MNNKKLYQDTFDQIKMSEEALRKVMDMSENSKKRYLRHGMRAAAAVMVLVVIFAVGNVAVYAATGDTLVAKVGERVSIIINGKKAKEEDIKKSVDKDGNTRYEVEVDQDNGGCVVITSEESQTSELFDSWKREFQYDKGIKGVDENAASEQQISGRLEKEGEKVYLIIGEEQKKIDIDITEDFSDGKAKGTAECNGRTYHYTVTGTVEKYDLKIRNS